LSRFSRTLSGEERGTHGHRQEEHRGTVDDLKGHVKEGAGGLTGDRDLEAEGRVDQLKGKLEKGLGDLRQGAKDLLDKASTSSMTWTANS